MCSSFVPIAVLFVGVFLPANLLWGRVPGRDALVKLMASTILAIGLWICFFYLTSMFGIRLTHAVPVMLLCLLALTFRAGINFTRLPALVCVLCAVCFLPYVTGYVLTGMLPGCDTAMHGYITRLIIEQQGLPETYRPLLPVDQFGAYCAGFHLVAASGAFFQPQCLMAGLSATTAVSHLVVAFGLAFLLSLFAPSRTALIAAIVVFWFHRSLNTAVDWGGTPTVLSLGLVFCALAFFGYAIREGSYLFSIMGATVLSAAALTHLIPAYSGCYLGVGLVVYWIWKYRPPRAFLLRSLGSSVATASVWLAPFVIKMNDPGSPELSKLIWDWQRRMMNNVITGDLLGDLYRLLGELKFSLSDLTLIAISACVFWLLFRRRYRRLALPLGLSLLLFAMIVNTGYWHLPFSELIYPERVMYFFVVPCGILMCYAAEELADFFGTARTPVLPVLAVVALGVGCFNCFNRYVDAIAHPGRRYDAAMREGFDWIGNHTAADAVIHVAYDTEGMWVPALSYRAAIGTHLHFIHAVVGVSREMIALPVDHYVLRVHGDTSSVDVRDPRTEMKAVAFKNGCMELIQTRRHK